MQVRQLKVVNFRGISTLNWNPGSAFCCLIGPGDAGKSTILDAIEAALSPRWFSFTEPDFLNCDTSHAITIEVTVGELSRALKSDERLGLYIRGWTVAGELRDEPEDDDEPVLTVRLTVDASMEPVWELVCDRIDEPRTLSNRDRALFGLVRLAGEDARHLAWGQGSVLARLTGDNKEAAGRLAEAYRAARDSANLDQIESLTDAAAQAEGFAKGLGAYVEGSYEPGLELGRSGLSSGSIALHDNGVPLRLAGLGTKRLATLAIQKSAIVEGAIVLVDEIEHGLEPHRIIGAISQLKADQEQSKATGKPTGQMLVTTHSDVALTEASAESLRVVRTTRPDRVATVAKPSSPHILKPLLRYMPRAMFSRSILVTEGNTELGMLLGIREYWPARHGGVPIEQLGAAIAEGNGNQAPAIAMTLASLGYQTALYRDSDTPLKPEEIAGLAASGIPVFEYDSSLNTEQAMFYAANDEMVQVLLDFAREEHSVDSVDSCLDNKIDDLDLAMIRLDFDAWKVFSALTDIQLREAIAEVALKKKWFKDQRLGRAVAPIVWRIACENAGSPLATTIAQAEAWLYA